MKVYIATLTNSYGGGLAVVIASSPEEARELLLSNNRYYEWNIEECNSLLPAPNMDSPCIIDLGAYTE